MTQKTAEQVKSEALAAMQEYFPNGGRDWDNVSALFDAIRDGKIAGLGVKDKIHDHACVNCFTDTGPCLGECHITDSNKKLASFEEATKPLIKWLAENVHPHHTVIVTGTGAELNDG
ncbi:hypothetical protein [Yersinia massiliensis]|uniref:hypothetical protein n=1 Tax=Yersinia massiliensis TaxID=419257 RepID=UPI0002FA2747|nr:hypothetical protein [Yersinia massiliensis]